MMMEEEINDRDSDGVCSCDETEQLQNVLSVLDVQRITAAERAFWHQAHKCNKNSAILNNAPAGYENFAIQFALKCVFS